MRREADLVISGLGLVAVEVKGDSGSKWLAVVEMNIAVMAGRYNKKKDRTEGSHNMIAQDNLARGS